MSGEFNFQDPGDITVLRDMILEFFARNGFEETRQHFGYESLNFIKKYKNGTIEIYTSFSNQIGELNDRYIIFHKLDHINGPKRQTIHQGPPQTQWEHPGEIYLAEEGITFNDIMNELQSILKKAEASLLATENLKEYIIKLLASDAQQNF